MQQVEDRLVDHNVIAGFHDEGMTVNSEMRRELTGFVLHVLDHVQGKRISVGRFLGPREAEAHVLAYRDQA